MFGDLVDNPKFYELNNCLTLALGKDISGQLVFACGCSHGGEGRARIVYRVFL